MYNGSKKNWRAAKFPLPGYDKRAMKCAQAPDENSEGWQKPDFTDSSSEKHLIQGLVLEK